MPQKVKTYKCFSYLCNMMFHPLHTDILPPERFNNPFYYEPHPLCILAFEDLQSFIPTLNLNEGKMFGVLVVKNEDGKLGYLAAYSGQIDISASTTNPDTINDFFVPAIFDYLQPDGYFKTHEKEISLINKRIYSLSNSDDYLSVTEKYNNLIKESETVIGEKQGKMRLAKNIRDEKRKNGNISLNEEQKMIKESQYLKAEVHRSKIYYNDILEKAKEEKEYFESGITELKKERKEKSDKLQTWLFEQFLFLNSLGRQKKLTDIWEESKDIPSGAGECCEPKLLQYAFANNMKPQCMAMFWWGPSPKSVIRQHLNYYPACNSKCKPILGWMLSGMDVDDNPLEKDSHRQLEIVFDDDAIVIVNKPAGMLSVPGKSKRESVFSIIKEKYPHATGPMIVHRLDMATSGLLVLAKDLDSYINLQKQFAEHTIKKRYVAILGKDVVSSESNTSPLFDKKEGEINLPLCPDIYDRPRQKVDYENGKKAITRYHILKEEKGEITIYLYPLTGRTHQLRVHCAHPDGLSHPIKGDELYGKKSDRMYLHAEYLEFTHPVTGERIHFERKPEWE